MKRISTILVLAVLMIDGIKASAQKTDCKYEKNEKDKFTQRQILQTKSHRLTPFISSEGSLDVSALKMDMDAYLVFDFVTIQKAAINGPVIQANIDLFTVNVPAGSEILILMADQSTVSLITNENVKGRVTYAETGRVLNEINYNFNNTLQIKVALSPDQLNALASKGSSSVRLNYQRGDGTPQKFDCDFGKKRLDVLQEVVKCIQ